MRVAQYLLTMLIVLSLNFFLPRMMPGDPLSYLTGDPMADMPMAISERLRERLLAYYGLDQPLARQYADYLINLAHGNLGWSIYYNAPVSSVLLGRLKWTLLFMGTATVVYVALGILLGALSAWRRGTKTDIGLLISVFSFGSWPPFFLAMLLIIFLSVKLGAFPIGGAKSPTGSHVGGLRLAIEVTYHLFLPCLALVLTHISGVYFLMRNSMLGVLGEDYVRTAKAKGLRERDVLLRHALPNALLPIVTMIAMRFGFLIMGTMFVEVVFAYPGMGTLIYQACTVRDYPLLQGAFLLIMAFVILFNLAADLLYVHLDPRVSRA
ncbi:MAG: ABC transporter permease [Chloroflexota bacterium]|nr:ABC transporter permease [Chloroflexota bacterium]